MHTTSIGSCGQASLEACSSYWSRARTFLAYNWSSLPHYVRLSASTGHAGRIVGTQGFEDSFISIQV